MCSVFIVFFSSLPPLCVCLHKGRSLKFSFFLFLFTCVSDPLNLFSERKFLKKKSVQVGMINLVFCLKYSHAYSTGFITVGITNDNCCVG